MRADRQWLNGADAEALRSLGARRTLPGGSVLFVEGDDPSQVVLVEAGIVKVTTATLTGREIVLEVVEAGELLGELSAVDDSPRSATATALTTVELVTVSRELFCEFIESRPTAMRALLEMVIERLRQSNRRQLEYSSSDALGRVCSRLTEMAHREGLGASSTTLVEIPFTQTEFAQWCGLSREAVVKSLRKLRDLGWIVTTDAAVEIHDLTALEARGRF